MRHIARLLAPILAATALALTLGAPVLAAPGASASPSVVDLSAEWCFQDGAGGYQYCFDVDGRAVFLDNQAGSSVTITARDRTVVTKDGVLVGESTENHLIRGVYQADGTVTTQDVVIARSEFHGERCTYQAVFRIADYQLVVDNAHFHCGG